MKGPGLFVLLFMSLRYTTAKNAAPLIHIMSIRLERCTSYCNPKYCKIVTVCRPLNRTSKSVSMDIYFHPHVKLEAPVYVKITALKKFTTIYRPHMVNFKTELCKELSFRTHALLFGLTKDQSIPANLLDPCPITGHRHTKPRITNLYDLESPLFPLAPAGDWRMDITLSVERNGSETVVVSWNDYYEIKPLTAEQF